MNVFPPKKKSRDNDIINAIWSGHTFNLIRGKKKKESLRLKVWPWPLPGKERFLSTRSRSRSRARGKKVSVQA